MMKLLIVIASIYSAPLWAQEPVPNNAEIASDQWICAARGYDSNGRRGMTVRGFVSESKSQAMDSALRACYAYGYSSCRISYCQWEPFQ